jgi:YebC/PmpR family DNA-binding regulatory protein
MSGHSKWATIKRQKGRTDAKRASIFAKLSREIIVAARGGADPAGNFQLRTAIDKAKVAFMPSDNIERAIAKGSGTLGTDQPLEAIRYEGYGPGGVAVLIDALTDNRNRTAAELRLAFSKNGGNLGETGCVGWMFEQKGAVELRFDPVPSGRGKVLVPVEVDEDALLEACLEGGADSYELSAEESSQIATVLTEVPNLEALTVSLRAQNYAVGQVELRWLPQNVVEVTDLDQARSVLKLLDALEDLDDVQTVTANYEMSDALMDETAG